MNPGALLVAALLGMQSAAAIAEVATDEPLGRLFFTPERRQALDRQRLLNIQEAQQPEDPAVTVNGFVKRSAGPATAWINGAPQTAGTAGAIWSGSLSGQAASIRLTPPGEAPRQIKVGETLYRGSGDVDSGLRGGQIKVRREPQPDAKPPREMPANPLPRTATAP